MAKQILDMKAFRKLNNAERRLLDLLPDIERCERCGLKMEQVREQIDDLLTMTQAIKKEFFPGLSVPMNASPSSDGQ